MPTTASTIIGTRTAFSISLNSLANVTYVAATPLDLHNIIASATAPLDVVIELAVTPGTVAGNKQALLFAQISMDGTNYTSGPTSGTTVTDQDDLYRIDRLPLNTNSGAQLKGFSVLQSIGFIPYAIKPVVFNDSGAAFAGSGCALYYTVITADSR